MRISTWFVVVTALSAVGCGKKDEGQQFERAAAPTLVGKSSTGGPTAPAVTPSATPAPATPTVSAQKPFGPFSLAVSEYPSWSAFVVAASRGYFDGAEGKLGEVEKKWNVDMVLREAEYDPTIGMYGSGEVDGVAITNMDALKPSRSRSSVAIMPTSTSYGADAVLTTSAVKDAASLGEVRGLELSVSQYMVERNLELLGVKPAKYKFVNMDPGAAALAMQQGEKSVDAIAVWNPFVLETLGKRQGSKVLFDSTSIPGEIIDMIVVGADSLKKPGGEAFAKAVVDVYYRINKDLADATKRDATLVAIGEKFSHLGLEEMKKVVDQTRFYGTAAEGVAVFTGPEVPPGVRSLGNVMATVVKFCVDHGIVEKAPNVAYESCGAGTDLCFNSSFMKAVAESYASK